MSSFNRVVLMGNLTRDPELRQTTGGMAICNLTIAVNRRVKKGERWEQEASFFDVVVFGKSAENASEYLAKGRSVLVEGELVQQRWENQEGQKRSKIVVNARQLVFLQRREQSEEGGGEREPGIDDNDIPF